ncbi:hypothetical protein EMCRGX_G017525 [Ephydatia muelleri]
MASGLKIGAFNVQIFGQEKLQDRVTMNVLSKIVRRFDVLLIEEIRSNTNDVIPTLLNIVNKPFGRAVYKLRISERLGTTSSKEQYAFVYRSDTVKITDDYQYPTNEDFERPPYSVLVAPQNEKVGEFFLLGVHVRPDNAFSEINNLHTAFLAASDHYGTQRGIILGDFNAGCSYLSTKKYRQLSLVTDTSFTWILDQNTYTNVKMTCPYDRIVAHRSIVPVVDVKTAKVFLFDEAYSLTEDQAAAVSDHYPVEVHIRAT